MVDGFYHKTQMSPTKILPIASILEYWANIKPNSTALSHEGQTTTWSEFEKETNRLARAYDSFGVQKNSFVVVGLPNGFEFFLACFATWKLGAIPLPISSRLPKFERDQILDLARPSLMHGFDDDYSKAPWCHLKPKFEKLYPFKDDPLKIRIADSWKAMTSGGSTGRPKIIVSKDRAEHDIFSRDFLKFDGSVLIPGPLYHNGPFLWAMHALFQGNQVTVTTRFDATETLSLIDQNNVDTVYMVPTMMHRVWNLDPKVKSSFSLKSLKTLWHLASPCPVWLKHKYIEWFGPDAIWELYGGTEGIGFTIISGTDWLLHEGSVGKAGEDFRIKILDEEENEVPDMEIGEVYLKRDDGVGTTYYYIGAEAKRTQNGWESYGDMGYLDKEGYLYLTDRKTDMILSGGSNIYPAEVESAIDTFPNVRSSAVIGLPDDDLGNIIHAIVDTNNHPIIKEELLEHLSNRLVKYKIPRSIEFVNEPIRDEAGKVRRSALREERILAKNKNSD